MGGELVMGVNESGVGTLPTVSRKHPLALWYGADIATANSKFLDMNCVLL